LSAALTDWCVMSPLLMTSPHRSLKIRFSLFLKVLRRCYVNEKAISKLYASLFLKFKKWNVSKCIYIFN
jgi:hypothetical protein